MADEPNGFDKRLRELEQWKAGTEEWRHAVTDNQKEHERKIDALRLSQAKWLGAIAVIAFLASMFGSAIADRLGSH